MSGQPLTAVLLFNYGGPESLDEVRPFLRSIFSDPHILALPRPLSPLRPLLATLIASARERQSRACYAAIGGRSPLNRATESQARALGRALKGSGRFLVLPSHRYWGLRTPEAIEIALAAGAARFVLLPLYPHHSMATTVSAVADFQEAYGRLDGARVPVHLVESYHDHDGFVETVALTIQEELEKIDAGDHPQTTLVFSAHGLPQRIANRGDRYPGEVARTIACVRRRLDFPGEIILSYQSKVGPFRWLGPETRAVIQDLQVRATGPVLVYPISFVSEHQETLYELDILYGEPARAAGLDFRRLPAAGCRPEFIRCLRDLTLDALERPPILGPRARDGRLEPEICQCPAGA